MDINCSFDSGCVPLNAGDRMDSGWAVGGGGNEKFKSAAGETGWIAAPLVAVILASAFAIPLPDKSVQAVVTSPPYFNLRRYAGNDDDGFGREKTVAEYVAHTIKALGECRRVLKDDGVVFWNIGDSYDKKSLRLVPERVAIAAEEDGWIVRDTIMWHKSNPLPESVKDRCTRAYEPVLMLVKKSKYFWNRDAIMEPSKVPTDSGGSGMKRKRMPTAEMNGFRVRGKTYEKRNPRNVLTLPVQPYKGAHTATFPMDLVRWCVKAASRPGNLVLDPFAGSGTVGVVAKELGRNAVLLDISPQYVQGMMERLEGRSMTNPTLRRHHVRQGDCPEPLTLPLAVDSARASDERTGLVA